MPDYNNTLNRNQQKGTGFTNLGRIIGANRNTGLSGAVGGGIARQTESVRSGLKQGLSKFQEEAEKQNIATGENREYAQQMINEPTDVQEDDVSRFETFRAGRYEGPTKLENQEQLQNQAKQAQALSSLGSSTGGRQALLQRFVGGAGYNQGQQRLDSLLLGQSGTRDLNAAARQARGLGQQVAQTTGAAQQTALNIANQNRQFAEDIKNQLATNLSGIGTSAQGRMDAFNDQRMRLLNEIQQAGKFEQGKDVALNKEQYDALVRAGFDPNSQLYNVNLGDYVQRSDFNATLASALKQQEAQRAAALARLSGRDISETNRVLAQAAADTKNVGTLEGQQAIKFNREAFGQGVEGARERLLRDFYTQTLLPTWRANPIAAPGINLPYMGEQWGFNTSGLTPYSEDEYISRVRAGTVSDAFQPAFYGKADPGLEAAMDAYKTSQSLYRNITPDLINPYEQKFGRLRKILSPELTAENAQVEQLAQRLEEQKNRPPIVG